MATEKSMEVGRQADEHVPAVYITESDRQWMHRAAERYRDVFEHNTDVKARAEGNRIVHSTVMGYNMDTPRLTALRELHKALGGNFKISIGCRDGNMRIEPRPSLLEMVEQARSLIADDERHEPEVIESRAPEIPASDERHFTKGKHIDVTVEGTGSVRSDLRTGMALSIALSDPRFGDPRIGRATDDEHISRREVLRILVAGK
ncbi:MAG: hypothetical protein GF416_01820 [Candidatus Altiarchaeales archaeon]|nr:hypothetical protein [Candidatus Altiarchaeales archaeon]MBD3415854.1 hypothetical protein [Candidatus Altiarchaeales archaeon]